MEIILITGLVFSLGWLLKKGLGWLIGKIVLPAQFRGGDLGLMQAISQAVPKMNRVYISKEGQYQLFGPDGQAITGSLGDLSDIGGSELY